MKITFIGGGNMAGAIIGGLTRDGFAAKDVNIVEPVVAAREQLAQRFGVTVAGSVAELAQIGDVVVLAVKPQQMRTAVQPLAARLQHQVVLSIAAGLRVADLSRWLGGYARIVRCMPNTPALIGAGITAACAPADLAAEGRGAVERILKAIGKVVWVDDEGQLDAVTAVSGSGPWSRTMSHQLLPAEALPPAPPAPPSSIGRGFSAAYLRIQTRSSLKSPP